jgi:SAM-dependent methyltransferase
VCEQRLVFGQDADRARPSYPDALIDAVVSLVGRGARALDVGAGTGKATALVAAREVSGLAPEPDPAMAEVARHHVRAHPHWRLAVAGYKDWQPGSEDKFDLVCCAQAWHWLDPAVRGQQRISAPAIRRLAGAVVERGPMRITRPSGPPWTLCVPTSLQTCQPGHRSQGSPAVPEIPAESDFGVPVARQYRWSQAYSADEWSDLLRTQSDHAMLPEARLGPLLGALAAVINDDGSSYRHPYVTWLWAAQHS